MDTSFRPYHDLHDHDSAPIPYSEIGADVVITKPKGYFPPSSLQRASITQSATVAMEHLREKEKEKLAPCGMGVKTSRAYVSGEEIIGSLLNSDKVLIPMAISPYGRIGHMMHAFLYGIDPSSPDNIPIKFSHTRPNAQQMYNRAMSEPTPLGLVHLATSHWKSTKPCLTALLQSLLHHPNS
jgi:hypothetical protein